MSLLLPQNSHLCLTITYSTTTSATWALSKSEPRAFNTPDQPTFPALRTQISDSPQSFNVVLDTGSSDLWVTTAECTTCTPGSPNFNSAASTSLQLSQDITGQPIRVEIIYGSGSVAGDLVRDTVVMGGFQVQNQPWLLVDQTSASLLDGSNAGIMGLAFDTIANTGAVPFWQTLAQGGQLSTPEMSFWFTRLLNDQSAQEEDFGGIFTLGGQNQTLFTGDIEFLPLVTSAGRQTYWLLSVSGTHPDRLCLLGFFSHVSQLQGSLSMDRPSPCRLATLLPSIPVQRSLVALPPSFRPYTPRFPAPSNLPITSPVSTDFVCSFLYSSIRILTLYYGFSLACGTTTSVTMAFGGRSWPIDAQDMNLGRVSTTSDICLGGIFDLTAGSSIGEGGGNPNWVVGATFLKNVYSVFRSQPAAIGFAQLSEVAGGSSGECCDLASSFY